MKNSSDHSLPLLPLPDSLRGCEPDSFAFRTISNRLPGIARRVLQSQTWTEPARTRLQALVDEMPNARLRHLDDPLAPDIAPWETDLAPYVGMTWLEAPWFVAETYFFRRILEATGYYQDGPGFHIDPYQPEKQQEFQAVYAQLPNLCLHLEGFRNSENLIRSGDPEAVPETRQRLASFLRQNIWGNQADRSMWPAGSRAEGPNSETGSRSEDHLLVDHSWRVANFLAQQDTPLPRIDLILDNGGIELAYDLALVGILLSIPFTQQVRIWAKPHPTYVSDVTQPDIENMIGLFEQASHPCMVELAMRLRSWLAGGEIQLDSDYYWTSPLSGWDMPAEIRHSVSLASLVISKGDANYRRWLGDRHWPHAAPVDLILAYFPSPWLALRVLKANLIAGLEHGLSEKINNRDPEWLHNGNWGIIQTVGIPAPVAQISG